MSRSAIDATRFTATSPHAYSKPSPLRSAASHTYSPSSVPRSHTQSRNVPPPPPRGSGNPTETPKEKVARLRAQHMLFKQGQITTWDKIVVRGRIWADTAHRVTVLGLMGFSVIAAGVTIFSLGDMIVYNRRKRNAWYAEQHFKLQKGLSEAREAVAKGIANDAQILLLNRERAAEEAEAARKATKGVLGYMKSLFSSEGLKMEEGESVLGLLGEEGLRKMGQEANEGGLMEDGKEIMTSKEDASTSSIVNSVEDGKEIRTSRGDVPTRNIVKAVEEMRREGERELEKRGVEGGPLDRMAKDASEVGKAKGGWTSWLTSK